MSLDCALIPDSCSLAVQYEGGCGGDEERIQQQVLYFIDIALHYTGCAVTVLQSTLLVLSCTVHARLLLLRTQ